MKSLLLLAWLALTGVSPARATADDEPLQQVAQPWHLAARAAGGVAPGATAGDERWSVLTQDVTVARTLERWALQAGVRVKWDAQRNFLVGAPHTVEGSFEVALQALLGSAGIRDSDYPLEACIYANTPPLVRITRQGEQARECEAP